MRNRLLSFTFLALYTTGLPMKTSQSTWETIESMMLSLAFSLPDDNANQRQKITTKVDELLINEAGTIGDSTDHEQQKRAVSALYFLHAKDLQKQGFFFNLPFINDTICKFFANAEVAAEALSFHWQQVVGLQEKIVEKATEKKDFSHKKRRHALNSVIQTMETALGEIADPAIRNRAMLTMAWACFHRGCIVRPKGFSIPAKKTDLFSQALNLLQPLLAGKNQGNTAKIKKEDVFNAQLLKSCVYLELLRCQDNPPADFMETLNQTLQQAITGTTGKQTHDHLHYEFALAVGEVCDKKEDSILTEILSCNRVKYLQKARASALLAKWGECVTFVGKAINKLDGESFFRPSWEQVVTLLKHIQKQNKSDWRDLSINLWKVTCKNEQKTIHGCHVRWYWSRQRDIYDLAFHAAGDDLPLKARIADSLKSRPAQHLASIEQIGKDAEDAEKWLELQMAGMLGYYTTNYDLPESVDKQGQAEKEKEVKQDKGNDWPELPKPWIAVHFYLSNGTIPDTYGKTTGYAMIHDSETGEWKQKKFDYASIWAAYWNWQQGYQNRKEKAARELEQLCNALGNSMAWLFNEQDFPPERPVVFIPHDFMHRLPLHVAISSGGEESTLFVAAHPVSFLPAWWYVRMHPDEQPEKPQQTGQKDIACINWNDTDIAAFIEKLEDKNVTVFQQAESKNLLDNTIPPSTLIIYSHAQAYYGNPWSSRLMLADNGPSIGEIIQSKMMLDDSQVALGACETDLMLPISSPIDEHVTLAATLLQKKAALVLGALWEVDAKKASELILQYVTDRTAGNELHDICRVWSGRYLKDYMADPKNNKNQLYLGAAFRVAGLPTMPTEKNNAGSE